MIRQDYIIQMIEQLGVLVRRIMNREISDVERDAEIADLTGQYIGLPPETLFSLPVAEVLRLFEQSNRMVDAKCLIMAELLNTKGMISENPEEKSVLLTKAAFFCDHAPADTDPALQSRLEAIRGEVEAEFGIVIPPFPLRRHTVPPSSPPAPKPRRRARPQAFITGAIILALLGWAALTPAKTFEVSDPTWESADGALIVRAILHNRTAQTQLITLQFTADQLSGKTLGSALNFAGKTVQTYTVEPNAQLPIEAIIGLTAAGGKQIVVDAIILGTQPQRLGPP